MLYSWRKECRMSLLVPTDIPRFKKMILRRALRICWRWVIFNLVPVLSLLQWWWLRRTVLTLWMCIDYWALSKRKIKNWYPIPKINEFMDRIRGAKCFSKIHLHSSYHQIWVREQDISKTTFRYHYGYYKFIVMPFGLTNAHTTFQSCMNHIFNK